MAKMINFGKKKKNLSANCITMHISLVSNAHSLLCDGQALIIFAFFGFLIGNWRGRDVSLVGNGRNEKLTGRGVTVAATAGRQRGPNCV